MNSDRQRRILLTGLFLALFFSSLDQTVVGTAMPRIIGELGGLSIMTWVTTTYMLTSTTVVPIAGKLADVYGRRLIYIAGLLIFIGGSALCGTSQTMLQLILYRALQGIGGGIMMPLAMTIVGDIFPPGERGRWQGIMGALFGLSSVVGPAIGGWIVDYASWQWVFYINLPIGFLATATIYMGLRDEKPVAGQVHIDYAGILLLIIGTVSLLLGLNMGGAGYSWLSWQIFGLLGLSFAAWAFFLYVEQRALDPVLSLDLFQNKVFAVSNMVGFLMGLGMFGALAFLPLFLQGVLGISATGSGNTMLPMMLGMMGTSILAGRYATRLPFRTIYLAGMSIMTLAFYLLSTMTIDTRQWAAAAYIALLGIGMGLIMPVITIAVQSTVGPKRRGVATSATQFFRSIGGTLGMTVLGVVFNGYSNAIMAQEFFPAISNMPIAANSVLADWLAKARTDPHSMFNILLSPETLQLIPAELRDSLLPPLKGALAESLQVVFWVAALIAVAGVLVSLLLGNVRLEQRDKQNAAPDAGAVLLAEGIAPEVELAAELVPDLIDGERKKRPEACSKERRPDE